MVAAVAAAVEADALAGGLCKLAEHRRGDRPLAGAFEHGEWERRRGLRLRFVYRRTGPSLLVAEGRLNAKGQAVVSRSKTGRGKVTRADRPAGAAGQAAEAAGPCTGCGANARRGAGADRGERVEGRL
ncbi:DUF6441 family protein [Aurantimonas sp. E1-2-R+4]|uniref:DUF6441 family protein n=1 Tax=Aurantimonas sp. E1-2-R+4 TaxID=3113714 RepID=UPI002F93B509